MHQPATAFEHAFIVGIERRSGTNFLGDLLARHPDAARPRYLHEDMLVHGAPHLVDYAEQLHRCWAGQWREAYPAHKIGASIGRGLLTLLDEQADRPARLLVAKTPRADHVCSFPWLFPSAKLLILIRDGRAVVQSAVKSFGWSYGKATTRWSRGARRILEFDAENRAGSFPYLIVRYERLVSDLRAELTRVLEFLNLPPGQYDFDAAQAMPVRASSTMRDQGQSLHWTPLPKAADFDPTRRPLPWSTRIHCQFLWRAGGYQALLGYPFSPEPQSLPVAAFARFVKLLWRRKIANSGLLPLAEAAARSGQKRLAA